MSVSCGFATDRSDNIHALKQYVKQIFSKHISHEKNVTKIYFITEPVR